MCAAIVSGMSDPYTKEKLLELLERRALAAQHGTPTTPTSSAPSTPTSKAPMSPTSVQARPNLLAKRWARIALVSCCCWLLPYICCYAFLLSFFSVIIYWKIRLLIFTFIWVHSASTTATTRSIYCIFVLHPSFTLSPYLVHIYFNLYKCIISTLHFVIFVNKLYIIIRMYAVYPNSMYMFWSRFMPITSC